MTSTGWTFEEDPGRRLGAPVTADELVRSLVREGVARALASAGVETLPRATVAGIQVMASSSAGDSSLRAEWRKRETPPTPLLLVVDAPSRLDFLRVLGPTPKGPVRSVYSAHLAKTLRELAGLPALQAVRQLASELNRAADNGLVVTGLLTRHTLESRFRQDPTRWGAAKRAVAGLPEARVPWRQTLAALGYHLERLPRRGYLAVHDGKPVAVVHPKKTASELARLDRDGRPPEGLLASDCKERGARWGILAFGGRYRLFDVDAPGGTREWLELDTGLLDDERRPFLALLAPASLAEGGFAALKDEAQKFGVQLSRRLDRTIRQEALPALAVGMERWAKEHGLDLNDDAQREELERAAMTLVFRAVFILFAESAGHLPMNNESYRKASLSGLVSEAHGHRSKLSPASSSLWHGFTRLVKAMRSGNPAWEMPAYNGALFAAEGFAGAEMLERMELRDPEFGRVLAAVGHDADQGRGVDFSTLEIAHVGHTYESLLGLRLSLATRPLRYDAKKDRYVSAPSPGAAEVKTGGLLWQTHAGGRKAGGVYYTPVEIVRHLVKGAVEPPFEKHLEAVAEKAKTDPEAAAELLLSFAVVDPACGSAHFLVQVAETLAEMTVRFLAEHPLPPLLDALERLREPEPDVECDDALDQLRSPEPGTECEDAGSIAQPGAGVECDDAALLRRLIVKHCVFGVDRSEMGAEVAKLSLWLASFVPGLSLAYLGRNVAVGDALIGVGDPQPLLDEAPLFREPLRQALDEAAKAMRKLAEIDDRTPKEVADSEAADKEVRTATEGMKRLFDLWTAEQFDLAGAREDVATHGAAVISGERRTQRVRQAQELAKRHQFLHWPLAFPHVFQRQSPGFDVVVGNPPWEEVTVEELSFYGLYRPGIAALAEKERRQWVAELVRERPELPDRLQARQARLRDYRRALAGPDPARSDYDPMGGDPDLYKYFCQRYRMLVRDRGFAGVVLPRTAFVAKGSKPFREWLYQGSTTRRVDFLLNRRRWAFDTHPQYSIALVVAQRGLPAADHRVSVAGTAESKRMWAEQSADPGVRLAPSTFGPAWETPLVRSQAEADLLARIRTGALFPHGSDGRWSCFPVAELHETNDKKLWAREGDARLWKGESFGQYDPHGHGERSLPLTDALWAKVRKPRPGSGSLLAADLPAAERRRSVLADISRDRLCLRDVTNRTNSRTVIACLAPKGVFLTNSAPYLSLPTGDELARAACLGVMNSLPFDWQARRFVELHVSFYLLEGLYVPSLADDDYAQIARAAARLSAVDDRFADFARKTGVECGPLPDADRAELRTEIDARVARAWGLRPADLAVIYEDFTLNALPAAYRTRLTRRLEELG